MVQKTGYGKMTSQTLLPYARQVIDEDDITAVAEVLRGDWLTRGPMVGKFETALAAEVDAEHAVVCNSGTSALYLAARATGLEPGDAVIVPSITFLASASAQILAGLEVVFSDVSPDTGLMEIEHVERALHHDRAHRIKAIVPVHLGGRVSDPAALYSFAEERGLVVIEDACHALGTRYHNGANGVGGCRHSLAACFSFHPVKTIAMGEGGAITTNSAKLADHARDLRTHGIRQDADRFVNHDLAFDAEGNVNPWYYEIREISHNLRAPDINCALGLSQLRKLSKFLAARTNLWNRYRKQLPSLSPIVRLIAPTQGVEPGWHLCSVLIDFERIGINRRSLMRRLRERGIITQVHYVPVHLQPFYRERYGTIDLPGAASYFARTLTLPLFPGMVEADVDRVIDALASSIAI
jgi:UDP-4-amino-4,6-dideoxy-N-acetyl-beta-L-altrosamine transaminase